MITDDLRNYMHGHYAGENIVAAAVGNIKHEDFVKMVKARMSGLHGKVSFTREKQIYTGGEYIKSRDIEQAQVLLGFPGVDYFSERYYPAGIMSNILGGSMSSRLFQEIREKRGLVYSVYSFNAASTKGGLFGIYAGTGEEETAELMPAVCDEILKIRNESISDEELARAKAQLKAGVLMSLEHPTARCEQNAGHLLTYGRLLEKDEILGKIAAVTVDDVQKLAEKIFSQKPTLASLGPVAHVMSFDTLTAALK